MMAQVKLGFKTATGTQFVVSRSMQLTVAKTKRTFKSLDASLLMVREGERTSMSTRVAGPFYPLEYPGKVPGDKFTYRMYLCFYRFGIKQVS